MTMSDRARVSATSYRTLRRDATSKEPGIVSSDSQSAPGQEPSRPEPGSDLIDVEMIREALRGLRFGQVTIIVQDGVLIQIDRLERRRLK